MARINLNFNWKFIDNFKSDYINCEFDDKEFENVDIPHTVKEIPYNYFNDKDYQMRSCYRKNFYCSEEWENKSVVITFEAIAHYAEVFINGKLVASHSCGYTAFSVDISEFICFGKENNITIMVDTNENLNIPPFGNVIDYLCYGGIYREVYIDIYEKDHIEKALVAGTNVLVNPKLDIKLYFSKPAIMDVVVNVKKDNINITSYTISCMGKQIVDSINEVSGISLWEIDNPILYDVEIKYNGEIYEYKVGFREAKFTSKGFYLNGKRVNIIGLNRHQAYPNIGYAMPKNGQLDDAKLLKSLGINLVRTSHYPNSKHFLNKCDELGILVFTEIPGWQHVSKDENWRNVFINNVKEMILECYNHPSIVLWGVRINESADDEQLYNESNKVAHELDKYRQTAGVRCFPRSQLLEDVYTFNDFTYSGGKYKLLPKFIVTKRKNPLLISEHNGHMFPTKSFDHEDKRKELALRHAAVINEAFKKKHCGAIGWCMSDYNTHKDFGSGDKICYHGVTDMFRMDKDAALFYRSQQNNEIVLGIPSSMQIGDIAGGIVSELVMFTNCDKIEMYKNDKYIGVIDVQTLAKKSPYKYLPNPPIFVNDIIGNQIEENNIYNLSKKDCELLKQFLLCIKKYGAVGAVIRKTYSVLKLMLKYKLGITSLTDLFGKYVTNWGDESNSYSFVGYKNNEKIVVNKACASRAELKVSIDRTILLEDETYDVSKINLEAVNQVGERLPYNNAVVEIETEGAIQVLGEKKFALIGGARAFWVRSKGEGVGTVNIKSDIGDYSIKIKVNKR